MDAWPGAARVSSLPLAAGLSCQHCVLLTPCHATAFSQLPLLHFPPLAPVAMTRWAGRWQEFMPLWLLLAVPALKPSPPQHCPGRLKTQMHQKELPSCSLSYWDIFFLFQKEMLLGHMLFPSGSGSQPETRATLGLATNPGWSLTAPMHWEEVGWLSQALCSCAVLCQAVLCHTGTWQGPSDSAHQWHLAGRPHATHSPWKAALRIRAASACTAVPRATHSMCGALLSHFSVCMLLGSTMPQCLWFWGLCGRIQQEFWAA